MAILNVRQLGDEVLTKKCKPVKAVTPRIEQLVEDMFETMYESQGVGLAAPQVGILKRIVVIDTTPEPENPEEEVPEEDLERFVMLNPRIISKEGEQVGYEGCLSYAGMSGLVRRPNVVTVEFENLDGDTCQVTGEGLLARAICHEVDHLDGIMYTELVEGEVYTNEQLEKMLEEQADKQKKEENA